MLVICILLDCIVKTCSNNTIQKDAYYEHNTHPFRIQTLIDTYNLANNVSNTKTM